MNFHNIDHKVVRLGQLSNKLRETKCLEMIEESFELKLITLLFVAKVEFHGCFSQSKNDAKQQNICRIRFFDDLEQSKCGKIPNQIDSYYEKEDRDSIIWRNLALRSIEDIFLLNLFEFCLPLLLEFEIRLEIYGIMPTVEVFYPFS